MTSPDNMQTDVAGWTVSKWLEGGEEEGKGEVREGEEERGEERRGEMSVRIAQMLILAMHINLFFAK